MPDWMIVLIIIVDAFQWLILMGVILELHKLTHSGVRRVNYPQHGLYAIMTDTEAYIYDLNDCTYIAKLRIDATHAWNLEQANKKRYIPINSILAAMGYLHEA